MITHQSHTLITPPPWWRTRVSSTSAMMTPSVSPPSSTSAMMTHQYQHHHQGRYLAQLPLFLYSVQQWSWLFLSGRIPTIQWNVFSCPLAAAPNPHVTRNMHAHLCLVPVCRLCVCIICGCRWGVHGMCYVCCRPRRSCLVLVVSKPQWPRHAVVPDLHLHHQRVCASSFVWDPRDTHSSRWS